MGFADHYVWGLNASTLQDDDQHHAAEPLFAAAVADMTGAGLGALLTRVKYADGTLDRMFEGNQQNMAQLLRIWTNAVIEKGQARRWVKTEDVAIAHGLFKRVSMNSAAGAWKTLRAAAYWRSRATGRRVGNTRRSWKRLLPAASKSPVRSAHPSPARRRQC